MILFTRQGMTGSSSSQYKFSGSTGESSDASSLKDSKERSQRLRLLHEVNVNLLMVGDIWCSALIPQLLFGVSLIHLPLLGQLSLAAQD
jgi:hypothetical protein